MHHTPWVGYLIDRQRIHVQDEDALRLALREKEQRDGPVAAGVDGDQRKLCGEQLSTEAPRAHGVPAAIAGGGLQVCVDERVCDDASRRQTAGPVAHHLEREINLLVAQPRPVLRVDVFSFYYFYGSL